MDSLPAALPRSGPNRALRESQTACAHAHGTATGRPVAVARRFVVHPVGRELWCRWRSCKRSSSIIYGLYELRTRADRRQ